MNVSANGKVLMSATKELFRKWRQTRESWQDAKAEAFESQYVTELETRFDRAAPVFEQLEKTLKQIREQCE